MDVYLTQNNNEVVVKMPYLPEALEFKYGVTTISFDSITQGELKAIGKSAPVSISMSGIIPKISNGEPYLRASSFLGWELVMKLDRMNKRRFPLRFILTDSPINLPVVMTDFSPSVMQNGDIQYSMVLDEFRFAAVMKK